MAYEFSKENLIKSALKAKFSPEAAARVANLPVADHVALMRRIKDFSENHANLSQNVGRGLYQLGRMNGRKFEAITQPQPMSAHMESLKAIAREVGAI